MTENVQLVSAMAANDLELMRLDRGMEIAKFNARLETVRMAQQTLIENARTRPVGERDVTAEHIAEFAAKLTTAIGA
jgi:hypothetical protein